MSKKVKMIVLSILLVLCLGGIVLEIKFLYPKYIKKNPISNNNKQQVNNKQDDKENDDNKPNIYEKYENIKWATSTIIPYNKTEVKVVGGKLECIGTLTEVCDLASSIGEPLKKISFGYRYVSTYYFYVLTETGKVFKIDNQQHQIKQIITDYTIIDMTEPYTNFRFGIPVVVNTMWLEIPHKDVYFLTQDGQLISEDKNTYEHDNKDFVRSNCFYYDEHPQLIFCLYYNKENHVSYNFKNKDEEFVSYKEFKNKSGGDLVAKYVYDSLEYARDHEFERKTLIIDENDDLYVIEYINNDFVINYLGQVTSVTCNKENWMLTFTLTDGYIYHFKSAETDYFDVVNKKAVPFSN